MFSKSILGIWFLYFFTVQAEEVRIGLFRYENTKSVRISYHDGSYSILADTLVCRPTEPGVYYDLLSSNGQIKLLRGATVVGLFDTIKIFNVSDTSSFKIKLLNPSKKERTYKGNLFITLKDGNIVIVNEVSMANYLGGVIESEGGGGRHLEYYKVQAILSRTYVLRNRERHKSEGFQLCDRVHCQAYHSMLNHTPLIMEAVLSTVNEVMVDSSFNLAQGYFHANCGGQTSESHYVWNTSISYLWSVKDTFCTSTRQATWVKEIPKSSWRNYLVTTFGYPENDSVYGSLIYSYSPKEREAFYVNQKLGIPLRDIREKFNLKSTYFSTKLIGDMVVLNGRGFGHGIGLCQEGAMNMAKAGYTYKQILKFYFQGILIGNYKEFSFFKGTDSFE